MISSKLQSYYHSPFLHVTLSLFLISFWCLSSISSTNASQIIFNNKTRRGELDALLTWKGGLDKQSQEMLASWNPNHPLCSGNWSGISCNKIGGVAVIDLDSYGLRDFGTARFLSQNSSNWTSFAGTFGYSAPAISEKCDVYSLGVLMLEVLMGTHPGDLISLSSTSYSAILVKDVIDQRITPPAMDEAEKVILIAKLAFQCLQQNSHSRPTMHDVSIQLARSKPNNVGVDFSSIKIGELL